MSTPIQIKLAIDSDLVAINDIYNHYVLHSTCTYQEELESIGSRRKWFADHDPAHPVTVAVVEDRVVGWGSLSRYHPRSAYRNTVEDSIYIDQQMHRRGIGSAILADLIARASASGHHTMIGGADAEQLASLALHARFGFEKIAHLREVGFKFGRWLDVIYMQLML